MPFTIPMNWIGSSHFKPSHHLPKAFKDLVARNPDLHRFSQEPEITTIYVMRDNFIEKTLKKVSESGPGPRVVFICIGSNDLRDKPTIETVNELMKGFEKLIEGMLKFEKTATVLISPIPDSWGVTDRLGDELSTRLKYLVAKHQTRQLQFVNFREKRLRFDADGSRWSQELFADDKHLNRAGADLLADEIIKNLTNIPNKLFGHGQNKKRDAKKLETLLKKHGAKKMSSEDLRSKIRSRQNNPTAAKNKRRRRR